MAILSDSQTRLCTMVNTRSRTKQPEKQKNTRSGDVGWTVEQIMNSWTVVDVARHFQCTRTTVIRWIQKGQLPAEKSPVDDKWLIQENDVLAFERPEAGNPDWIAKR